MADSSAANSSLNTSENVSNTNTILSQNRVRTIMKSSPDVMNISQESLFAMTKAAEFFMQNLLVNAYHYRNDQNSRNVSYGDLANYIQNCDDLEFLQEIVPPKVKASEVWHLIENNDD